MTLQWHRIFHLLTPFQYNFWPTLQEMLGLLLLATKLMSFRTPGAATLVALVSLSETVMTAPALCFNRETTFENGTRVTNLYFFRRDPHTMDTTVVMQPGAGTGIFSSGERQKEVYMGNVQQTFLSHENLVFKSLLPGLQTYRFSPSGVDFLVVHDGRTLLNLSRMIGNQGKQSKMGCKSCPYIVCFIHCKLKHSSTHPHVRPIC
jgi:hypothetical protein